MLTVRKQICLLSLMAACGLLSCKNNDRQDTTPEKGIAFKDQSKTPALIKKLAGFESMDVYSLIGSDDTLSESKDFIFGGSADGAGLIKQADKYIMLVNHEDNFAVSRITLDKTFKPVKGEYIMNTNGGQWRLCSATMATPEEHGFGPMYLTCGESNEEANVHGLDPVASYTDVSSGHVLKGLGFRSAENAVPLPQKTYTGKSILLIGEDDDAASGGQLFMYISDKVGDLQNGKQYMLRRTDLNQKETDIKTGNTYDVEFVNYSSALTGAQVSAQVDQLKAIKFGRVEDVDYRKGTDKAAGREIYFTATGQDRSGYNADGSRTMYGRVYRLVLDETNPLKGKLEVILDGDDDNGPAKDFQDPDNICVTKNYVYVQEDSNGYGTEDHDAYIYQYNIATRELKKVFELDHRRNVPGDAQKFGSANSKKGSWEYGALVDISDIIGVENTFTLSIQPHSWTTAATGNQRYTNADGGARSKGDDQASQIVLIKGLPR